MSIHIGAKKGDIAESVLLAGDPLRAKHVAENLLENEFCYNEIRAMYGYTGMYRDKKVSIQGSGMGMPSMAIYATELIKDFNVKTIIRVGTCGTTREDLSLGQVIIAQAASGDSQMNKITFNGMDYAAVADFSLLVKAYKVAQKLDIETVQGSVFSTDTFYHDQPGRYDIWVRHGILAVEMETQVLYTIAAKFGVRALSLLTVSDNLKTGERATAKEREQSFMEMIRIALELV